MRAQVLPACVLFAALLTSAFAGCAAPEADPPGAPPPAAESEDGKPGTGGGPVGTPVGGPERDRMVEERDPDDRGTATTSNVTGSYFLHVGAETFYAGEQITFWVTTRHIEPGTTWSLWKDGVKKSGDVDLDGTVSKIAQVGEHTYKARMEVAGQTQEMEASFTVLTTECWKQPVTLVDDPDHDADHEGTAAAFRCMSYDPSASSLLIGLQVEDPERKPGPIAIDDNVRYIVSWDPSWDESDDHRRLLVRWNPSDGDLSVTLQESGQLIAWEDVEGHGSSAKWDDDTLLLTIPHADLSENGTLAPDDLLSWQDITVNDGNGGVSDRIDAPDLVWDGSRFTQ